jgi:hypothetical protein
VDPDVSKERLLMVPAFIAHPLPQFFPKSGAINQVITLNGTNFNAGSIQVRFGTVPATVVGAASATQLLVRVPPGLTPAGTAAGVKITVTDSGGSHTSDHTFTALPIPAFADAGGQFAPSHGMPGQQIAINGFNFNTGNTQVMFGTIPATPEGAPTATQVVVQTPAGLVPVGSTTADVKIMVMTAAGSVLSDDTFRAEINTSAPPLPRAPR